MTVYQEELLRKLPKYECTGRYDEKSKQLEVFYHSARLCYQDEYGYIRYHQKETATDDWKSALNNIEEQAEKVREYVQLYRTAFQMGIPDVSEYRRMAEYGDIVLAGTYSEENGFMFTTWRQNADKTVVAGGDYSPDFDYVKNSFVTRSGLLNQNQLFNEDEAANLYRCINYTQANCDSLTFKQEMELKTLEEKLRYGYPKLENELLTFEQTDVPQLNM